jgi:hypothetical protein
MAILALSVKFTAFFIDSGAVWVQFGGVLLASIAHQSVLQLQLGWRGASDRSDQG